MYYFFLGKTMLPVTPEKLTVKINNANKTYTLINEGEVSVLKTPELTDIEFDALLPNVKYPFAVYKSGFRKASYYLDILSEYKEDREPFQFIVSRVLPSGKMLSHTNMKVSLESYTVKEDREKYGLDVLVSVKLKQYRSYGTKICTITTTEDKATVSTEAQRSTEDAPKAENQSYTVVKGDCLWKIAKKYYGDGSKYTLIYNANTDQISNPDLIYPGQVLTIPAE